MQNIHRGMKLTVLFSVAFCFISFTSLANFADPEIAANNTTLCEGANIELKLKNLTAGDAYQWVKDGNNLDSTREALIVSTPGVYKLKVTNNGNTITSNTITINPKPYVNFSYSATDVCPNTPIDFKYILSDGSQGTEGSGFTYSWDYKDGDKENKFNPTHTFKVNAGAGSQSFDVQFTIKDNNGCTNQTTKTISIKQKPDATLNGTGKDVINSESYFKICSSTGTSFQFTNPSTTKAKNTSYTFIWGDNSLDYTTTSFDDIVTHSYSVGLKTMIYRVYNGACYDEKTYKIFVGNIPAGGISGIGGSTICAGDAQKFLITNSTDNPAGTSYTLSYGDGKPDVVFYHPAPDTVKNIFLKSSCDNVLTSGNKTYRNAFGAFLEISNPCGSASGSILPIYVSDKPDPQIGLSDSIICVNQTVNIANTGYVGKNVQNDKCTAGNLYWGILGDRLGTSYNITTGVTGDGFGSGDPSLWSSGTNNLSVQFATLGKYDVSLTMANNTLCGAATTMKTICVNPLPTASFTTDATEGCAPFTITAKGITNDITCGQNKFEWTVTYKATADCDPKTAAYSFVNNTDKNSQNPQIKFDNPGVYTIELITIAPSNKCTSAVVTKVITVKSIPNVVIDGLADACQAATVNPKATISCYTTNATYNWTATGGTFVSGTTSTSTNPQISFTSSGNYSVQLAITNSCGTTTASKDIKIKPTPSLTKPSDVVVCANSNVNAINFTSSIGNTTFNWKNDNTSIGLGATGVGNIVSFTGLNATIIAKVATITVTPDYNGCTGVAQTFTITVNPLPVLTDPSTSICIGTSATLNVSGADTYTWTPATGLSATTGASVTANPTTTTTYTIRGTTTATGCSTTKNITVTVANAPVINVNDATICLGNSVTLNATGANTFSWTPATGLSTTAGASVTANPTTTTTYTVTGSSGAGCTASKNVTVTVNPNPTISIPNGVICNGNSIDLNATGADTYVWTPATGLSATSGAMVKASPTNTTKYTVTGTKTTTGCSAQGTTTVTVNPNPTVVVNSGSICPGFSLPLTATGADNFNWTNNTTTLSGTTGATVTATPTATTAYTVRGTNTTTGCYSDAISTVTVNEVPQIDATFTNPLTCGGNSGTITITGFRASSSYVIYYEKDGVGNTITASANAAGKIILNNLTKGVYDKIEARLTGCISNRIGSYTLVDPSAPATPSLTNTGPICSGNNFTLNTTYSQANATYTWTGPSGFNITTTTNSTTVNNATVAAAGIYKLFVTLANCNSPEASTEVIINPTPLAPIVTSPVTYCQRAEASPLIATALNNNTLQWY
ncbi:MAG: hypothetical protein K9I82_13325, partial [Chitinophagaceae bacterium]|nr:hypothetical protein [Chitinophagaceae bacterium]